MIIRLLHHRSCCFFLLLVLFHHLLTHLFMVFEQVLRFQFHLTWPRQRYSRFHFRCTSCRSSRFRWCTFHFTHRVMFPSIRVKHWWWWPQCFWWWICWWLWNCTSCGCMWVSIPSKGATYRLLERIQTLGHICALMVGRR